MVEIKIKMSVEGLLKRGMIHCESCGHPPNNHFNFLRSNVIDYKSKDLVDYPCAHCVNGKCKGFLPDIDHIAQPLSKQEKKDLAKEIMDYIAMGLA